MPHPYEFRGHNASDLIDRGKATYGSKVDNSVCECPVCYGGKRVGMLACNNCKGEGVVRNEKEVCPDCEGNVEEMENCGSCGGTGRKNMTKKDYELHAAQIKAMPDRQKAKEMAEHLAPIFISDNPSFDKDRFLKACGL